MSRANRAKRARPKAPPALEGAMDEVFRMTEAIEDGEENRVPHLYMWGSDGTLTMAALAIDGAGPQFACAARLMVLQTEPVVAVIGIESWGVELDTTIPLAEQDWAVRDWLQRRAQGEDLGVVDLPPDYRSENLNLIGEHVEGAMADRMYRIRPYLLEEGAEGPGDVPPKRRFERLEGMEVQDNRFHPLFILPWAKREGIPEAVAKAALRREAAQVGLLV